MKKISKHNVGGFTLIELLVVVLIIGILSAVALPQYQKTVLKSRTAEAWSNLSALKKAREVYCLENPSATVNWINLSDLPIEVSNSDYFSYAIPPCNHADTKSVYAEFKKQYSYCYLGFGPKGERNCLGSCCVDIGITNIGSWNECFSGGGSCYYVN